MRASRGLLISRQPISRIIRTGRLRLHAISLIVALIVLTPSLNALSVRAADAVIRLNTVGFLPAHDKRASVAAVCTEFSVVNEADGKIAFRGKTSGPAHNADTNEDLYVADFLALRQAGAYHLEVQGVGRSAPFRISQEVYHLPSRIIAADLAFAHDRQARPA